MCLPPKLTPLPIVVFRNVPASGERERERERDSKLPEVESFSPLGPGARILRGRLPTKGGEGRNDAFASYGFLSRFIKTEENEQCDLRFKYCVRDP